MHEKTQYCQRLFNLPSTEQIVQNYGCVSGKLWISFNFFCYSSKLFKPVKISFRSVRHIEQSGNRIEVIYEIAKGVEEETFFQLSSFKGTEVYNIMQYLRYNAVSFVPLEDGQASRGSSSGLGDFGSAASGSGGGGGWGMLEGLTTPSVDVAASEEAVRQLLEARRMGLATLEELSEQRKVIDRLEHTTLNIHANLDKSQRVVTGLASFGGGLKNLVTRDRTRMNNPAFKYLERDIHLRERAPDIIELSILLKHPDDTLTPAVIRFSPKTFEVYDPVTKGHRQHWHYTQIDAIVLRARPLHLDVRFPGEAPRFRMMTSHGQAITNELFLRSLNVSHEPEVVFEPNAMPFGYGSYRLSLSPSDGHYDPDNPFTAGGAQVVVKGKASDLLHGTDQGTKDAFDQLDRNVDIVSDITADLKIIAQGIGQEVEESTDHIRRVGVMMADGTNRARGQAYTVEGMRHY